MGHVPGQALGADNGRKAGFALAKPIEIRVLPARRALDYISEQPKKKKRKKAQPERNYSTTEDMFSFVRRLIPCLLVPWSRGTVAWSLGLLCAVADFSWSVLLTWRERLIVQLNTNVSEATVDQRSRGIDL